MDSHVDLSNHKINHTAIPPKPQNPTAIKIFRLENARASAVEVLLSEFCSPVGKIQLDEATNSLIIMDEVDLI